MLVSVHGHMGTCYKQNSPSSQQLIMVNIQRLFRDFFANNVGAMCYTNFKMLIFTL